MPALIGPSNRLGLDYAVEAASFRRLATGIIDVHTHVNGVEAAAVFKRAAELYGVRLTYSMTKLEEVEPLRELFGDAIRFIAVPNFWAQEDRRHHMGRGFLDRIAAYHALGTRIVKFWAAPRGLDFAEEDGDRDFMRLDAPHRIEAMELASELGMIFMTHVADPDTWFRTKYADAARYGTKRQQYEPLERLLDRFRQPWIAAHMGGWPEDLEFLDGLLERHDHLHLDTSATKWMVRELSRHSRDELLRFLVRWSGRILFGSDVVTSDEHLTDDGSTEMSAKAGSREQAFDLYSSRYWALRTMWETSYEGESPIADPDLHLVDPSRHAEDDAPTLRGHGLPEDVVQVLHHAAAHALLEPLHEGIGV